MAKENPKNTISSLAESLLPKDVAATQEAQKKLAELQQSIDNKEFFKSALIGFELFLQSLGVDVDEEMLREEEAVEPKERAKVATRLAKNKEVKYSDFASGTKHFQTNSEKKSYFEEWYSKWKHAGNGYIDTGSHYQSEMLQEDAKKAVTDLVVTKGYGDSSERHGWQKKEPLVIVANQTMYMFMIADGAKEIDLTKPESFYLYRVPCSTGKNGWGYRNNSNMTPPGHAQLRSTDLSARSPREGIATMFMRVHGIKTQEDDKVAVKLRESVTDPKDSGERNHLLSAARGIGIHDSLNKNFGDNVDENLRSGRSAGCIRIPTGATLALAQQVRKYGTAHLVMTPENLDEFDLFA